MIARRSLGVLLGSTLWLGASSAAMADPPPAPEASPRVVAAMPRVAQKATAAATPATPVSTAQVGAVPGPGGVVTPPMTLWRFLGIPQGLSRIAGATTNRRGNFPGLEPKPPLKALADPANLMSKNPAIKKAAEVKQEEDLAKQKIKALKYLATIGCGCYPGVKEALMAALDDCTEKVRYEAAKAIGSAAENKCETCSKTCCCDADMMQALYDKATKRDDNGCYAEPSARVREAACEALLACRRRVPVYPAAAPTPYEGETIPERQLPPGETIPDAPPPNAPPGAAPAPNNETRTQAETDALLTELFGVPAQGKRPPAANARIVSAPGGSKSPARSTAQSSLSLSSKSQPTAAEAKPAALLSGRVVGVDQKTATVDLEFGGNRQPTVGSRFSLHHAYAFESVHLGEVEVVYLANNGRAIAKPVGKFDLLKVAKGDQVSGRTSAEPASEAVAAAEPLPVARPKPKPASPAKRAVETPRAKPAVVRTVKAPAESMVLRPANAEPARPPLVKPSVAAAPSSQKIASSSDEARPPLVKPSVAAAPATPVALQGTIRVVPPKRLRRSAVIRPESAAEKPRETSLDIRPDARPAENDDGDKTVLRLTSGEQSPPIAADARDAKPEAVKRELPRRNTVKLDVDRSAGKRAADHQLSSDDRASGENAEPRIIEPLRTAHVSAPKASEITFAPPGHPAPKNPAKRSKTSSSDQHGETWVMIGD